MAFSLTGNWVGCSPFRASVLFVEWKLVKKNCSTRLKTKGSR